MDKQELYEMAKRSHDKAVEHKVRTDIQMFKNIERSLNNEISGLKSEKRALQERLEGWEDLISLTKYLKSDNRMLYDLNKVLRKQVNLYRYELYKLGLYNSISLYEDDDDLITEDRY